MGEQRVEAAEGQERGNAGSPLSSVLPFPPHCLRRAALRGCRQEWRARQGAGPGVPRGVRERRPSPALAAGANEADAGASLLLGLKFISKRFFFPA